MDERATKIYSYLKEKFPEPMCELNFKDRYQLLVSVILSAQCTDKRVNTVTKGLFKKYPTAETMAKANLEELEQEIKPCGFYHNKAKNILSACQKIVSDFDGEVPEDYDKLLSLPGVGRKTANVITSAGFGGDAIAVDTHVFRVSRRLGLASGNTPEKVEQELMKALDKNVWSESHFLMVLFGRYVCKAQRPLCEKCGLKEYCKYYKEIKE